MREIDLIFSRLLRLFTVALFYADNEIFRLFG